MQTNNQQLETNTRKTQIKPSTDITPRDFEIAFALPRITARLLHMLYTHRAVSAEEAQRELAAKSDAKSSIFRLRRHLAKFGIMVQSQRFIGYWLSEADKKRVEEITSGVIEGGLPN